MKKTGMLLKLAGAVLLTGFISAGFVSCNSLQKDRIIFSDEDEESFIVFEQQLVNLDGAALAGTDAAIISAECAEFIADIENQIDSMGMNNAVQCRLYALEGRAYLLMGNTKKAKSCYDNSVKLFKGDAQSTILAYRLGLIDDLTDAGIVSASNNKYLLVLEQAISCYIKKDFINSAAYFDEAFMKLDEFYVEAYSVLRQNAWNLKDLELLSKDAEMQAMLEKAHLTTGEMLVLTQNITDYLYACTDGRELEENDLYLAALSYNLLTSISAETPEGNTVMEKDQIVTRILCARYLWNLYCLRHETYKDAEYSKIFRQEGIESPVADLDLYSEDFDAVLYCIENEIINMTDGINFEGDEMPTAFEVGQWLQAVR